MAPKYYKGIDAPTHKVHAPRTLAASAPPSHPMTLRAVRKTEMQGDEAVLVRVLDDQRIVIPIEGGMFGRWGNGVQQIEYFNIAVSKMHFELLVEATSPQSHVISVRPCGETATYVNNRVVPNGVKMPLLPGDQIMFLWEGANTHGLVREDLAAYEICYALTVERLPGITRPGVAVIQGLLAGQGCFGTNMVARVAGNPIKLTAILMTTDAYRQAEPIISVLLGNTEVYSSVWALPGCGALLGSMSVFLRFRGEGTGGANRFLQATLMKVFAARTRPSDAGSTYLLAPLGELTLEEWSGSSKTKRDEGLLDEAVTLAIVYQILKCLLRVHGHGYMVRSMAPASFQVMRVVDGVPLLCLVGLQDVTKDMVRTDIVGVPPFSAPQVSRGERYDYNCDKWSGAATAMFCGGDSFREGLPVSGSDQTAVDNFYERQFVFTKGVWRLMKQRQPTLVSLLWQLFNGSQSDPFVNTASLLQNDSLAVAKDGEKTPLGKVRAEMCTIRGEESEIVVWTLQ